MSYLDWQIRYHLLHSKHFAVFTENTHQYKVAQLHFRTFLYGQKSLFCLNFNPTKRHQILVSRTFQIKPSSQLSLCPASFNSVKVRSELINSSQITWHEVFIIYLSSLLSVENSSSRWTGLTGLYLESRPKNNNYLIISLKIKRAESWYISRGQPGLTRC